MIDSHQLKNSPNPIKSLLIKNTTLWKHPDHVSFLPNKQQRPIEFIYIKSTKLYQPNLTNICQKLIIIKNSIISTKKILPPFPNLIILVSFLNQQGNKNKDTYLLIPSCVLLKRQNTCIKLSLLLLSNSDKLKIPFIKIKTTSDRVLPKHLIFIRSDCWEKAKMERYTWPFIRPLDLPVQ